MYDNILICLKSLNVKRHKIKASFKSCIKGHMISARVISKSFKENSDKATAVFKT